jgi:hypothetical protein
MNARQTFAVAERFITTQNRPVKTLSQLAAISTNNGVTQTPFAFQQKAVPYTIAYGYVPPKLNTKKKLKLLA